MKKSFIEIIRKRLVGEWCDGIALLTIDKDNVLTIENIFSKDGVNIGGYPIELDRIFSEVKRNIGFADAMFELAKNNKTIITCNGNVISKNRKDNIILNDYLEFKTINEFINNISKEEIESNFTVF